MRYAPINATQRDAEVLRGFSKDRDRFIGLSDEGLFVSRSNRFSAMKWDGVFQLLQSLSLSRQWVQGEITDEGLYIAADFIISAIGGKKR